MTGMKPGCRLTWIATFISLLAVQSSGAQVAVPILVYHRLGLTHADAMTVTTKHFEEQLELLCKNNFTVIRLSELVAWRLGRGPAPPQNSVVLTFDDGHLSVYREARPIVLRHRLPVTLFIYPSCISDASYAMSWDELRELIATPFFDVHSHTFWHPNFKQEAKRLDEHSYETFVDNQLQKSKAILESELHRPINLLAWPFGINDPFLVGRASAAGYEAGFSIECRAATLSDPVMSLPRCLVSDEYVGPRFLQFIRAAMASSKQ